MCMREEKNLDAATMHQGYGARACVCLKNSLPLVSTLEYFVGFHHNERLKAYVAGGWSLPGEGGERSET